VVVEAGQGVGVGGSGVPREGAAAAGVGPHTRMAGGVSGEVGAAEAAGRDLAAAW
jgi:hypothetical protein